MDYVLMKKKTIFANLELKPKPKYLPIFLYAFLLERLIEVRVYKNRFDHTDTAKLINEEFFDYNDLNFIQQVSNVGVFLKPKPNYIPKFLYKFLLKWLLDIYLCRV